MSDKKKMKVKSGLDIEKYLTEMKELPEVSNEELVPALLATKPPKKIVEAKVETVEKSSPEVVDAEVKKIPELEEVEQSINKKYYSVADIVLGIINTIAVIVLFIVIIRFPALVEVYKKLQVDLRQLTESAAIGESQIDQNKEKFEKIESSFLPLTEIVNFVNDIESIKTTGSTITNVNFTKEVPVKDKTGNSGYPLIIEMAGTWEAISLDIEKIDKLPYLFRVVSFDSEKDLEEGMIILKYGGILYVKDN